MLNNPAITESHGEHFRKAMLAGYKEGLQQLANNVDDPPLPFTTEKAKQTMLHLPCNTVPEFMKKVDCIKNEAAKTMFLDICSEKTTKMYNLYLAQMKMSSGKDEGGNTQGSKGA